MSIRRFLSRLRMKDEVVEAVGRLMVCAMVLWALTIACTLLLVLNVVDHVVAEAVVGLVMLWFAICWLPSR
ncbi:hypothetical protein HUT19_39490 [Streptomyces sp. NA02950]|uniref:DUF6328 family protein n=1 Tax=Streptomyces sp. NA02950 TaxID=2742137 RepID=UPI0015903DAC|nr:hypothetical protein HUT19_39490 [Streptomyces sp. NA02950]